MKWFMRRIFMVIMFVALAVFVVSLQKVEARGGGFGGARSEGASGESLDRGNLNEGADRENLGSGQTTEGPRGGEVSQGPYGGMTAEGSRGGEAAVGPYGRGAAVGPNGGEVAAGPRGVAAENSQGDVLATGSGVAARDAVAVGRRVAVLPATATEVAVGDQVYYFDSGVYYQVCDGGYCVAENPQGQSDQGY